LNGNEAKDSSQEGQGRSRRFNFRKRNQANINEPLFESGSVILKNVHASGQAPKVDNVDPVPLKMFVGRWSVSVSARPFGKNLGRSSIEATEQNPGEGVVTDSTNAAEAMEPEEDNVEATRPAAVVDPKQGKTTAGSHRNAVAGLQTNDTEVVPFDNQDSFFISVTRVDEPEKGNAVERYCSSGDLLQLHAQISESTESILTQLVHAEARAEVSTSDATNHNSPKSVWFSMVENVEKAIVVGRILGGLLDYQDNSEIAEKTRNYQGE
jgi:hypothetical protein